MAFRGELELGMHVLETDLHATRDGVLVLHHDERVDRTTNGSGLLREYSWTELRRLDAGYRFTENGRTHPYRGRGITIPSLAEAVALEPDAAFNVEIKQRDPDIVDALWRFIDDQGIADRFVVAAEHDPLMRRFRKASSGRVATSAGGLEARQFWAFSRLHLEPWLRPPYDALQVPERAGAVRVVDRRFVDAAHRLDLQVHVWTIDEPDAMRRLLALGVDGLMSDRPDLLSSEIGRMDPSLMA